jgi:hypothetical protein
MTMINAQLLLRLRHLQLSCLLVRAEYGLIWTSKRDAHHLLSAFRGTRFVFF